MSEQATEQTPRETLLAIAARCGLTMESTFVPYSQSRNAKPDKVRPAWPSLNWRVRLMKPGHADKFGARDPVCILETDYSSGSGHTPASQARSGSAVFRSSPYSESVTRANLVAWEIEHGKAGRYFMDAISTASGAKPLAPDFADVLASLARDSDVLDAGGFEDWARDLGYDPDSRSAEATYRACLEIALKMRSALGDAVLSELRAAAAEY